jgi:hypothetical protein
LTKSDASKLRVGDIIKHTLTGTVKTIVAENAALEPITQIKKSLVENFADRWEVVSKIILKEDYQ